MTGPARRERDAFERAVEALARKERTTAELAGWLLGRGFAQAEADAAVARLIEIGELDDERFARRGGNRTRAFRQNR